MQAAVDAVVVEGGGPGGAVGEVGKQSSTRSTAEGNPSVASGTRLRLTKVGPGRTRKCGPGSTVKSVMHFVPNKNCLESSKDFSQTDDVCNGLRQGRSLELVEQFGQE